jgi:hypothetical protein
VILSLNIIVSSGIGWTAEDSTYIDSTYNMIYSRTADTREIINTQLSAVSKRLSSYYSLSSQISYTS